MKQQTSYRVQDFTSADEFLDALSPRAKSWADGGAEWAFRGQADAAWGLMPSAFRSKFRFRLKCASWPCATVREQLTREMRLVAWFCRQADRNGIPIPDYERHASLDAMTTANTHIDVGLATGTFPPQDMLPLFGLSQHHGIPTRLLDWSCSQYVAAWFAASDAATLSPRSGRLAVWALNTRALTGGVSCVTVSHANNANLRAQKGFFTVLPGPASQKGTESPVCDGLDKVLPRLGGASALRKLTLPSKHAGTLLRLLDIEGYSAASMFPGLAGVVKAVAERGHWDVDVHPWDII